MIKIVDAELLCSICGKSYPVYVRQVPNVKKLKYSRVPFFCSRCQRNTAHIEIENKRMIEKNLQYKKNKTTEEQKVYQLLQKRK